MLTSSRTPLSDFTYDEMQRDGSFDRPRVPQPRPEYILNRVWTQPPTFAYSVRRHVGYPQDRPWLVIEHFDGKQEIIRRWPTRRQALRHAKERTEHEARFTRVSEYVAAPVKARAV